MNVSEWMLDGIQALLMAYTYLLLAMVIIYWLPDVADTRVGWWITRLTEPYLGLFRRFIPPLRWRGLVVDWSVLVAMLVYLFIQQGVVAVLAMLVHGGPA
ncbi:MAG: YggT family protein [Thermoflavifilum sp.]|nr:YggT family protein [Thermoflavifilum sp.]MCL6513283.1 YggT family protein [Alicyclobacillus sp.]